MKQIDHDRYASEQVQTRQASMARRDAGNADAMSWAWARAKLAEASGRIPCPECGCGFYLGCSRCGDTGVLNADGSRQEHAGELL